MKILVAGDFCQKYRVDEVVKQKRYELLFDEVKPIIEEADYSIVNFEFPIVLDSTKVDPIPKSGPNLRGTIEAVDAIKYAGFDCCTLANNHILDQGQQCCLDTIIELQKSGIDTVGAGKNLTVASSILYKEIRGEKLAVINCCEHEFTIATEKTAGANPLNPIQQFYKIQEARRNADYVLVIVHGGHEHYQLPSPRMQETYRFFIDAGADAVVNHHQHCYSGYEEYKGKPIFYGLGNFCFDNIGKRKSIWNDGYMVTIDFKKGDTQAFQLTPYSQCNENVTVKLLKDKEVFDKTIIKLNQIICDEESLLLTTSEYYASTAKSVLDRYIPYENKFFKKLFRMHMLPSLISTKRYLSIWNYIECEAHRDKQIFAFRKLFKME